MREWMIFHPWMTFFLLLTLLMVIEEAVHNICLAVMSHKDKPCNFQNESQMEEL